MDTRFCGQCGKPIKEGARFCVRCGAPIDAGSHADISGIDRLVGGVGPESGSPSHETGEKPPVDSPLGSSIGTEDCEQGNPRVLNPIVTASIAAAIIVVTALALSLFGIPSCSDEGRGPSGAPAYDFNISQVDNSLFPEVTLYTSILENGAQPSGAIDVSQFSLVELDSAGKEHASTIKEVTPLAAGDEMSINLVLDQSESMDWDGKMDDAKDAADSFISDLTREKGNSVEITSFDDYVYNVQPFTTDAVLLESAVNSLEPEGSTALYDALYWALQRTNLKSGSRVVIAFTDGEENRSYYSLDDVVELSRLTGIPVYVIGIGDDVDRAGLRALASDCNGSYYDANVSGLRQALERIYDEIYTSQRAMYRVVFTSSYTGDETRYRTVRLSCADGSGSPAVSEVEYVPVDNVDSYDTAVSALDYVLPDSGTRYYSKSELEKMSLWELYLARNEIFARYGRGFKNQDLVDYFATKRWYRQKETPEQFDAHALPFNDYERKNIETMLEIERSQNSPYLVTAK